MLPWYFSTGIPLKAWTKACLVPSLLSLLLIEPLRMGWTFPTNQAGMEWREWNNNRRWGRNNNTSLFYNYLLFWILPGVAMREVNTLGHDRSWKTQYPMPQSSPRPLPNFNFERSIWYQRLLCGSALPFNCLPTSASLKPREVHLEADSRWFPKPGTPGPSTHSRCLAHTPARCEQLHFYHHGKPEDDFGQR